MPIILNVEAAKEFTKKMVKTMEEYVENFPGGTAGAMAVGGAAVLATAYYLTRPSPLKCSVPYDHQAFETEGPEMIRFSRMNKNAKVGAFTTHLYDDARTMNEVFRRGARVSNDGRCLGWRENTHKPYQWLTYNEALLRAQNFGSGLVELGLHPKSTTYVGIYAANCPEWILTEQGLYQFSMCIVPLYDTLGTDACAFIISQASISTVVVDVDAKVGMLLSNSPKCLKRIIHVKPLKAETYEMAQKLGVELLSFIDVEKLGAARAHKPVLPRPQDVCTICYTSGTTGNPKGVMLSHENVVADVSAVIMQLGEYRPTKYDVMISFLPLAHMLERCCEVAMYMEGGAVGFFSGDIRNLMSDMKALKPTVSPTVPRLLNRIYDGVMNAVNQSTIKKMLFKMAMNSKMADVERGIIRNNTIWDKLVFRKVQDGMGGRVRLMVVGSAPLAGNVLTFMRCALGAIVIEGYGQTECVAPCTLTLQGDATPEHVGPPLACCQIKLVDVADMDYYAASGQGEVCVKGTNVFQGYFKDDAKTRETIDADGWLHTGDIGTWLPNGTLKIVDRRKHIFKLSQGEYIAPEKIENIYLRSKFVQQVFVTGESLQSCVVAVVVPEVDAVKDWASNNGIPGTLSVLCAHPEIKQLIITDITAFGKQVGLKSFEQVKDIYLHPDPFSVQNGLLTPTLKSKRPELKKYFKPQIEDMYAKLA